MGLNPDFFTYWSD